MHTARRVAVATLGVALLACSSAGDARTKDSARSAAPAPAPIMTTLQPRPELDAEIDPRDTMFAPGSERLEPVRSRAPGTPARGRPLVSLAVSRKLSVL